MKTINYSIQIYTYWHCGSGLAAGADVDLLPVKNKKGLPYVPGKTIKGLVREAAETICSLQNLDIDLNECFGFFDNAEEKRQGQTFFTNAELSELDCHIFQAQQLLECYVISWWMWIKTICLVFRKTAKGLDRA